MEMFMTKPVSVIRATDKETGDIKYITSTADDITLYVGSPNANHSEVQEAVTTYIEENKIYGVSDIYSAEMVTENDELYKQFKQSSYFENFEFVDENKVCRVTKIYQELAEFKFKELLASVGDEEKLKDQVEIVYYTYFPDEIAEKYN